MKLVGLPELDKFKQKHPTARSPINAWIEEVKCASWSTSQSIKDQHRSVDFLHDNRVIFNIKGNSFRLVVKVNYKSQIVLVEWIGTHAEYSKRKF